ncbi:MAG: Hsp20/alpha crystallin family protein [Patescibacteria group bacterium]|nr:Hsp20/alpha crystallin family protein [Patescibacteria group bacterium]
MAKRSLLDWLTGGESADDFNFDELEVATPAPRGSKKIPITKEDDEPLAFSSEDDAVGELAIDMHQTPTHIIIKAMIAGVRPDDLDVSITRDSVTIRGKRERATEGQAGDFFFQELYWGSFARTIMLPQEVEIEEAEATEKHGLLVIKLPKLDKGRQAKLKVKSN